MSSTGSSIIAEGMIRKRFYLPEKYNRLRVVNGINDSEPVLNTQVGCRPQAVISIAGIAPLAWTCLQLIADLN
jgi:hypothetical protein